MRWEGGLSLGVVVIDYFGFSTHVIMSSVSKDSFISSFQVCIPFISFSCLIALASTSSMMLESSGETVVHLCLVSDLSGKALSFLPLSMMLPVGFCRCSLSSWGSFTLFPISWEEIVGNHYQAKLSLYISDKSPFQIYNLQTFVPSLCCLFTFIVIFFEAQMFLILMKSDLSIFLLLLMLLVSYLRMLCQIQSHEYLHLCFLLRVP